MLLSSLLGLRRRSRNELANFHPVHFTCTHERALGHPMNINLVVCGFAPKLRENPIHPILTSSLRGAVVQYRSEFISGRIHLIVSRKFICHKFLCTLTVTATTFPQQQQHPVKATGCDYDFLIYTIRLKRGCHG